MSLRRKILLVFLLVNVLTLGGLAAYGLWEGNRSAGIMRQQARMAGRRARVALELLRSVVQRQLDALHEKGGVTGGADGVRLPLTIRSIPEWSDPAVVRFVRRAVIVRLGSHIGMDRYFNLGRRFIFDRATRDNEQVRALIARSARSSSVVMEGERAAGPLTVDGLPWGGLYMAVSEEQRLPVADFDATRPLKYILVIAVPGILFLLWFLLQFMNRSVLTPLDELNSVARAVARGDYSRRVSGSFRPDEIGRVNEAVNAMLDLVEDYRDRMEARVQANLEIINRKNQELMLGQRLAATGTLASGIAHEINNPLGGMLNALQRLRREDVPAERKETYLALIHEGIERIGSTVRQVLSVSPRETVPGPVDLAEIARRSQALVSHRARGAQVRFDLDLSPDVPPVLGESNEIGQVVLNLLINAVDACTGGGAVRVSLKRDGDQALFTVADDGPGMAPEVAAQAFDYFFTTKAGGGGTGLGLAIVHHIVEAHNGAIQLETAPGGGARFEVRLPLVEGAG